MTIAKGEIVISGLEIAIAKPEIKYAKAKIESSKRRTLELNHNLSTI